MIGRTDTDVSLTPIAEAIRDMTGTSAAMYPSQMAGAIRSISNGVTSFNGRTGDVVPESGDYTAAMVGALDGGIPVSSGVGTGALIVNEVSGGAANTASGLCSHASGRNTTASGFCSHAEGYQTTAEGEYSHAEGYGSSATQSYAHAEGYTTTASGRIAHAEGNTTTASGVSAHAEGNTTTASGGSAHAEGRSTTASGYYSHTEGIYTIANHKSQHVFGEYNVLDTNAAVASVRGNYVEIVGNGTADDARSNARTLDWSGNEVLAGKLTLGAAPTADMDAATKLYVDTGLAGKQATLTFDSAPTANSTNPVTSGGVKTALDGKANTGGSYPDLTAGLAEQLDSSVYTTDQVPYSFRTSGGSVDIGDREDDTLVGGTVAWNQMLKATDAEGSGTKFGLTFTKLTDHFGYAVSGTYESPSGGDRNFYACYHPSTYAVDGHTYLLTNTSKYLCLYAYGPNGGVTFSGNSMNADPVGGVIVRANGSGVWYLTLHIGTNIPDGTVFGETVYVNAIDLTQMFGAAIADYLYTLRQSDLAAAVAWPRKLFPKDAYDYDAGTLMSVNASAHVTVGFNAYDSAAGTAKLVGGQQYQITGTYTALSFTDVSGNTSTPSPDASGLFSPAQDGVLTVTGGNGTDTCVHLVWDGERNGEWEAYNENRYALDSSLTLRGIPALDGNNRLYYDGDTYASDGAVTRNYRLCDLTDSAFLSSTYLLWNGKKAEQLDTNKRITFAYFNLGLYDTQNSYLPNSKGLPKATTINGHNMPAGYGDQRGYCVFSGTLFVCLDLAELGMSSITSADSDADIKAALVAALETYGLKIICRLATPTAESAAAFTNPQAVDDWGTEEYVDAGVAAGTRDVAVPVGHVTKYLENLRAKLEMAPNSPDGDGDYIVRQTSGTNSYVALTKELPALPTTDGSYVLQCSVSGGTATLSWASQS